MYSALWHEGANTLPHVVKYVYGGQKQFETAKTHFEIHFSSAYMYRYMYLIPKQVSLHVVSDLSHYQEKQDPKIFLCVSRWTVEWTIFEWLLKYQRNVQLSTQCSAVLSNTLFIAYSQPYLGRCFRLEIFHGGAESRLYCDLLLVSLLWFHIDNASFSAFISESSKIFIVTDLLSLFRWVLSSVSTCQPIYKNRQSCVFQFEVCMTNIWIYIGFFQQQW